LNISLVACGRQRRSLRFIAWTSTDQHAALEEGICGPLSIIQFNKRNVIKFAILNRALWYP